MFKDLNNREKRLRKEADRCKDLNDCLVSAIKSDWITEPEELACAISWLDHSDLSAWEIMEKFK